MIIFYDEPYYIILGIAVGVSYSRGQAFCLFTTNQFNLPGINKLICTCEGWSSFDVLSGII